jgi:hypothetical protein
VVLDECGALSPERVVRIATQVAASLEEAHGLGIVHRDLKPDNILLIENAASERDVVKLVDFGIAKGQPSGGSATTKLTELGTFVGTPAYMSPEQFSGGNVSARSDIYSLGVTVYQMLAGRLPFEAQSILEWAQAHLNTAPPPLAADHGAGPIPEHTRRAVLRALSKDPTARQISAAQLAGELAGRGATANTQASDRPDPLVAPALAAPHANVQPGPLKTAPMTQLPDAARSGGPATTQPMAQLPAVSPGRAAGIPLAPTLPPGHAARRRSRGWLWVALLVLAGGGALAAAALLRVTPWQLALRPEPAPPPLLTSPELPTAPAAPAPSPPTAAPSNPEEEEEEEEKEPPPAARPPAPAPTPPATPAPATPPAAPNAPAGVPPIQLPPGIPSPVPTTPAPAPSPPTAPPGLPQLPWSLPTAGACERCLAALNGGGNYIIVTAVAEGVLCEDRTAREACERKIAEMAPAVAERAARAGDCPAALATAAAAMNVRVSPDQFAIVNTLCLR